MKVKELIEELLKCDPEAKAIVLIDVDKYGDCHYSEVQGVTTEQDEVVIG